MAKTYASRGDEEGVKSTPLQTAHGHEDDCRCRRGKTNECWYGDLAAPSRNGFALAASRSRVRVFDGDGLAFVDEDADSGERGPQRVMS